MTDLLRLADACENEAEMDARRALSSQRLPDIERAQLRTAAAEWTIIAQGLRSRAEKGAGR